MYTKIKSRLLVPLIALVSSGCCFGQAGYLQERIPELMKQGDIPGLSLVLVKNGKAIVKHFGQADIQNEKSVTDSTLFELGSCSKAFTAIAILKLSSEKNINLDHSVSDFIPWFSMKYEGKEVSITLRQLLHHTSGIPSYTLSLIPESNSKDALDSTVRRLKEIPLKSKPGQRYEYATVNYDIIGLVIEYVTGQPFEEYLEKKIFKELGLTHTYVGRDHPGILRLLAKGYKIGFFTPREYDAPVYKGNNPAGYVISRADDMSRWLQLQMGVLHVTDYDSLIAVSHQRDESVPPTDMSSYAYGWFSSLRGDGEVFHSGLNPNYTSYVLFRKDKGFGVLVMANSNSPYTKLIAENVMKSALGEQIPPYVKVSNEDDKNFAILSIILAVYMLSLLTFLAYVIIRIFAGKREYAKPSSRQFLNISIVFFAIIPFLYGLYILPQAYVNFNWQAIMVWAPVSLPVFMILCLTALVGTFLVYIVTIFFPDKNQYMRVAPKVILLSVLSGLSNTIVILLITSSIESDIELKYLLYYFVLAAAVYVICRKVVQTDMIYLTRDIIYNLRMKMMGKIFSTSHENFEKMDRGRIYSIMNYDIGVLGESANTFITIITSIITSVGTFFYMGTLSFWATMVIIILIFLITTLYNVVSRKTNVLFEAARETNSTYMRLLNGLIDGFKQLSIHRNKKQAYKEEVREVTDEYRVKIRMANVKFVNAFLIGESLLLIVLAIVAFAVPNVFKGIDSRVIMSFVILLLYLIGPINSILNSIPQLMQFKISWKKIDQFINDIPATIDLEKSPAITKQIVGTVDNISVSSLSYQYETKEGQQVFSVGPIDFTAQKGEIIFIIGGNGSGKTTLSKLLTGLYTPNSGEISINNQKVPAADIGEFFSTVFHPLHLFEKLYDNQSDDKSDEYLKYLDILKLKGKVEIRDNKFSSIDLSGGQRKRLALLQCYLEDKPIYLFDEWAADQDPEFRKIFYRELLPEMKKKGKIVFAITHDDHYFDVADKILKLEMGKIEFVKVNIHESPINSGLDHTPTYQTVTSPIAAI